MTPFHTLSTGDLRVTLDLATGHIRQFVVSDENRTLAPLHTAPWVDDPTIMTDETIPASLRHLSGDFFCAPFCASDLDNGPPHGWTANSRWHSIAVQDGPASSTVRYRLDRSVLGAVVEKRFTLRRGHPFLYQTHIFHGGEGALPVANHAMVTVPEGGRLAFSPKRGFETPAQAPEPDPMRGRSLLAYPAAGTDASRVPLRDGRFADITTYPIESRHEDVLALIEAEHDGPGWLAVSRPVTRDAMLTLKNPLDYPATVLWMSNGGRNYPPWNGRHTGVLGVEEARSYLLAGHRASVGPNSWSDLGLATCLRLESGGIVAVRNVIGAVALPEDGSPVRDLSVATEHLTLRFENGRTKEVPFDATFLNEPPDAASAA